MRAMKGRHKTAGKERGHRNKGLFESPEWKSYEDFANEFYRDIIRFNALMYVATDGRMPEYDFAETHMYTTNYETHNSLVLTQINALTEPLSEKDWKKRMAEWGVRNPSKTKVFMPFSFATEKDFNDALKWARENIVRDLDFDVWNNPVDNIDASNVWD
jgi:hypothetical protein